MSVRDSCLEYMLDSGIGDETVTNEVVIEKAKECNPSYVIPKDYLHDQDSTTESVKEFMELYKSENLSAEPVIPLQPPFVDHIQDLNGFRHYALGGIKKYKAEKQIEEIRKLREHVGHQVRLHGLGLGMNLDFCREIRENPWLLDSIDLSTPEQASINNSVVDKTMAQIDFEYPKGQQSSAVRAGFVEAQLLLFNYSLSPFCDDDIYDKLAEEEGLWQW